MPLKCFFYACTNESESSTASFHKFPDDAESCEKWVDFCQSDELNEHFVLNGPQSLRFKFVCSDHFRPQCYVDPTYPFKGLRKHAVPTIEKGDPKLLKAKPVELPNVKRVERAAQLRLTTQRVAVEASGAEMTHSCQCDIDDEFRDKFLEELKRGERLVKEMNEIQAKSRALKKPLNNCSRSIQTLDKRIKLMSQRLRTLEEKHGIQAELSSDEEEEEQKETPDDEYIIRKIPAMKHY